MSSQQNDDNFMDKNNSPCNKLDTVQSLQILKRPSDDNSKKKSKNNYNSIAKDNKPPSSNTNNNVTPLLTHEDKQARYLEKRQEIFGCESDDCGVIGNEPRSSIDPFLLLNRDFAPKKSVCLKRGDTAALKNLDSMYGENNKGHNHSVMSHGYNSSSMPSFQDPRFVYQQQANFQQQQAQGSFIDQRQYSHGPPPQQFAGYYNNYPIIQQQQSYQPQQERVMSLLPMPSQALPTMDQAQQQQVFYGNQQQFYAQHFPPINMNYDPRNPNDFNSNKPM